MWQNITRKSSIDYNRKHQQTLWEELHYFWMRYRWSSTNSSSNSASWEPSESRSRPQQYRWTSHELKCLLSFEWCSCEWVFLPIILDFLKTNACEPVLHSRAGLSWREFHAHILQTNTGYRNQNSQKQRMSLDITPSQNIWISSKW